MPETLAAELPGLGPDREVAACLHNRLKRFADFMGPLPVTELSNDLHASRMGILNVLRRLEAAGFIATISKGVGSRPSTIQALPRLADHFENLSKNGSAKAVAQVPSCTPRVHKKGRSVHVGYTSVSDVYTIEPAKKGKKVVAQRALKAALRTTERSAPRTSSAVRSGSRPGGHAAATPRGAGAQPDEATERRQAKENQLRSRLARKLLTLPPDERPAEIKRWQDLQLLEAADAT